MGETSVANRRHNSYAISPINILPFTLLHEEIHAAVDFHFRPKSDERESALVSGLQEPPAIIGEFYALYLAQFDEPPTRKQLQSYSRFYPPQTRMGAFLRLCSADTEAEEVIRLAVKAAGLALCSANDSELANSLSSLLGTRRSARQLRRAFTASSSLTKC
jgi:hypothetical protein